MKKHIIILALMLFILLVEIVDARDDKTVDGPDQVEPWFVYMVPLDDQVIRVGETVTFTLWRSNEDSTDQRAVKEVSFTGTTPGVFAVTGEYDGKTASRSVEVADAADSRDDDVECQLDKHCEAGYVCLKNRCLSPFDSAYASSMETRLGFDEDRDRRQRDQENIDRDLSATNRNGQYSQTAIGQTVEDMQGWVDQQTERESSETSSGTTQRNTNNQNLESGADGPTGPGDETTNENEDNDTSDETNFNTGSDEQGVTDETGTDQTGLPPASEKWCVWYADNIGLKPVMVGKRSNFEKDTLCSSYPGGGRSSTKMMIKGLISEDTIEEVAINSACKQFDNIRRVPGSSTFIFSDWLGDLGGERHDIDELGGCQ